MRLKSGLFGAGHLPPCRLPPCRVAAFLLAPNASRDRLHLAYEPVERRQGFLDGPTRRQIGSEVPQQIEDRTAATRLQELDVAVDRKH